MKENMEGTRYSNMLKHFSDLKPAELYAVMRLRNEVFVVEQNCVYQDADNKDIICHHLMLYDNKALVAYARLLPPGLSYEEMSIGRVVTSPSHRGIGAGKLLMQLAIESCYKLHGRYKIRIGAQVYAKSFYESLGFCETGDTYDEDGIPHVEMIRTSDTA